MNLKNKIENKIESLRTSILKCSVEQKFLRAYFLKLSFNLMLTAMNKWKKIQHRQFSNDNKITKENNSLKKPYLLMVITGRTNPLDDLINQINKSANFYHFDYQFNKLRVNVEL